MEIVLLYLEECPHWQVAEVRVREVAAGAHATVRSQQVSGPVDAQRLGFNGSPTILVDGRDPLAQGAPSPGLSCRCMTRRTDRPERPRSTSSAPRWRAPGERSLDPLTRCRAGLSCGAMQRRRRAPTAALDRISRKLA